MAELTADQLARWLEDAARAAPGRVETDTLQVVPVRAIGVTPTTHGLVLRIVGADGAADLLLNPVVARGMIDAIEREAQMAGWMTADRAIICHGPQGQEEWQPGFPAPS